MAQIDYGAYQAPYADSRDHAQAGYHTTAYPNDPARDYTVGTSSGLSGMANIAGAVVSLALLVGVGVWGYKLVARDVSGVPVIRAAEGPMRVQPEDPGGRQALHQGLSVNQVAAEGGAAKPADQLILAPAPVDLAAEDVPQAELGEMNLAEAPAPEPVAADPVEDTPQMQAIRALAEQLAEGSAPLTDLAPVTERAPAPRDTVTAPPPLDLTAAVKEQKVASGAKTEKVVQAALTQPAADVTRPRARPATLDTTATDPAVAAALAANAGTRDVDPASIPAGTRLAQLGAFESAEVAEREWSRLTGRFGDYLDGKDRVIQKAESGGRTFYRLRAMGFSDLADARRFCAALVAERAECIPVVTR